MAQNENMWTSIVTHMREVKGEECDPASISKILAVAYHNYSTSWKTKQGATHHQSDRINVEMRLD